MNARHVAIVRAYAIELAAGARLAQEELEACVDALCRWREDAERALERCNVACDLAERYMLLAARALDGTADPEAFARVAEAILESCGAFIPVEAEAA